MIGIFDSGVGGLSILKTILKQVTTQDIVYLADQNNFPYGEKAADQLKEISFKNSQFLINQGADLIIVACNTATTNTIDFLRSQFSQPIIGIEPPLKLALTKTKTGHILVLSTRATQKSRRLKELITNFAGQQQVYNLACPQLVELVETGQINNDSISRVLTACLETILADKQIDTISLGCTHFGLLTAQIKRFFEENGFGEVKLIEPAEPVVKQLKRILFQSVNRRESATKQFFTTGSQVKLDQDINLFLGKKVKSKQVHI